MKNGMKIMINAIKIGTRCFTTKFEVRLSFGMNVRCVCFSMARRNVMIRDGKTVMVQITPSRTPFAMTTPMSSPSVSCMVHMARKPAIVVRELPVMEENVFLIAATMASSSDAAVSFSSS